MAKKIRNQSGFDIQDPAIIHNLEYNNQAGSKKVSEVGRKLVPIPFINSGALAYTCDASTLRTLPKLGVNLAVYNNSGSIGSVTLGEANTQTSLAAGVTDANGHAGIPCQPNTWTYIACNESQFVISSAATLLVFIIDDNSAIKQEAAK